MSKPTSSPAHYNHGREQRTNQTLVTAVQALFGGSVVYRLFAHFMKDPEFEAHVAKLIPKDKLPLIAAGTVAAGAVGLLGNRRLSQSTERELTAALDEMTEEARELRAENAQLRGADANLARPGSVVRQIATTGPLQSNKLARTQ